MLPTSTSSICSTRPTARAATARKSLVATDYYNRLASRVTAALSVATAAGPLYDVDTRLRPQGAKGMLAVSLAAFAAYQQDEAWTWEHMALTRARAVYGSAKAADQARGDPRRDPQAPARRCKNRGRRRRDARRHGTAQAAGRTARHQARPGRADRPRVRGSCPAADARRRPSTRASTRAIERAGRRRA